MERGGRVSWRGSELLNYMLAAYKSKAGSLRHSTRRSASVKSWGLHGVALTLDPRGILSIPGEHPVDTLIPLSTTPLCQGKRSYLPQNKGRSEKVKRKNREPVNTRAEVKFKVETFKGDNN